MLRQHESLISTVSRTNRNSARSTALSAATMETCKVLPRIERGSPAHFEALASHLTRQRPTAKDGAQPATHKLRG
jgi:hypothetical protein